jgi:hypothetical protein
MLLHIYGQLVTRVIGPAGAAMQSACLAMHGHALANPSR